MSAPPACLGSTRPRQCLADFCARTKIGSLLGLAYNISYSIARITVLVTWALPPTVPESGLSFHQNAQNNHEHLSQVPFHIYKGLMVKLVSRPLPLSWFGMAPWKSLVWVKVRPWFQCPLLSFFTPREKTDTFIRTRPNSENGIASTASWPILSQIPKSLLVICQSLFFLSFSFNLHTKI
jgi:hypothetical protein